MGFENDEAKVITLLLMCFNMYIFRDRFLEDPPQTLLTFLAVFITVTVVYKTWITMLVYHIQTDNPYLDLLCVEAMVLEFLKDRRRF